jgi:hypothetical protein
MKEDYEWDRADLELLGDLLVLVNITLHLCYQQPPTYPSELYELMIDAQLPHEHAHGLTLAVPGGPEKDQHELVPVEEPEVIQLLHGLQVDEGVRGGLAQRWLHILIMC